MTEKTDCLAKHRWALLVAVVALLMGMCVSMVRAGEASTYPIDSYFYLSKAKQLARGEGLSTNWNDGADRKYFPGYSLILAGAFLLGQPHIIVQLAAYVACAALVFVVARVCDLDDVGSCLALTAFAANPIAIKWFSAPMAEGTALALCLISTACFLRFASTRRCLYLAAACAVGGFAAATRMESVFLLAVFGAIVFPEKRNLKAPWLLAGAMIFALPLAAYWLWLRTTAGEGPAYVEEFRRTLRGVHLLENFLYNVWVQFGTMHRPEKLFRLAGPTSVPSLSAALWLVAGELVFLVGLVAAVAGRLGGKLRSVAVLFLTYAFLHSFWYYRYERFMLMALPMGAILWAAAVRRIPPLMKRGPAHRWRVAISAQLLLAVAGLYLGNHYASVHNVELRQDTAELQFADIARAVNDANLANSPVLTDLGPHLAYYLDAHAYLDTTHGNYWQRAFPPERTLQEMERLEIGLVVTKEEMAAWLDEHQIPPGAAGKFEQVRGGAGGATIIRYSP